MITRELLVALRTDLTQVVYAWLSEREIKAYALFADADMETCIGIPFMAEKR